MHGRVLIIDDDRAIARLIAIWLEAAGHHPIIANDGVRGLELAEAERPDLVLLDIRMPDPDGFEVNARLKASRELGNIPVIFLSANVQDTARKRALASGARAFIEKPFDSRGIIDVVNRVLREPEQVQPTLSRAMQMQTAPSIPLLAHCEFQQERHDG